MGWDGSGRQRAGDGGGAEGLGLDAGLGEAAAVFGHQGGEPAQVVGIGMAKGDLGQRPHALGGRAGRGAGGEQQRGEVELGPGGGAEPGRVRRLGGWGGGH